MFSTREMQVLAGVARGKSNREIASDLGLSELTIKSHVRRVLNRGGKSPNRAALVTWGYRNKYLRGLSKEYKGAAPGMTNRELEVLQGICHGWDNGYIGRRLFLTEDTIKTYVARLLKKWGAKNRTHLVAFAWQAGVARESWWETPPVREQQIARSVVIESPAGAVCPTCGGVVARILDMSESPTGIDGDGTESGESESV